MSWSYRNFPQLSSISIQIKAVNAMPILCNGEIIWLWRRTERDSSVFYPHMKTECYCSLQLQGHTLSMWKKWTSSCVYIDIYIYTNSSKNTLSRNNGILNHPLYELILSNFSAPLYIMYFASAFFFWSKGNIFFFYQY